MTKKSKPFGIQSDVNIKEGISDFGFKGIDAADLVDTLDSDISLKKKGRK